MKESMHKYFKVGVIQFMSYPAPYDMVEAIKKIACDDYFDTIEITQPADEQAKAKIKKILNESKLNVCYASQPKMMGAGLNPNHIDEAERQKAEDFLKKQIDEAEQMGSSGIAMLAGKWEEKTKDQAYAALVKTTKNLCDYAKAKDMSVTLEVFDYDVDKAVLIGPAPYAQKFAAEMRSYTNNFGLLVDLSHFPITRESSKFVIRTLRPYITHLHIGNAVVKKGAPGYGDLHPRFGFPDSANDTAQLLDFLRVIKDEGFMNAEDPIVMSFEVKPFGDEDPDILIANCKRTLNRAWALLED